jgi:peptidoglycan/LPS O-acetylase OafA/YrhL
MDSGLKGGRNALIDGLRGIAALSVVLYHFNTALGIPSFAGLIARHGNKGVAVFFVLSGFVITLSLGDQVITPGYLGRFALRRSLRLDPPYLCSIAVMIALAIFGARYGVHADLPDGATLLAHALYLQDLLRLPSILPIYWSLCLEIQFYLTMALILFTLQRGEATSRRVGQPVFQSIFLLTVLASLACRRYAIGSTWEAPMWYCFAVGASTYWAKTGWIDRRYTYAAIGTVLAYGIVCPDRWAITAGLTALLILTAPPNWLSGRIPQFLGRISYSLYLTHLIVGWYALALALRFVSKPAAFMIGMSVALGTAYAWYVVIERPAVRLSHKIRPRDPVVAASLLPNTL